MNAAALIRQLVSAGIRLTPNGERLRIEAKPGAVTDELRTLITNRKVDLLAELDRARRGTYEARRATVETALRSRPELRVAFDVADAPMRAESGAPVSVMLAVRHGEHILTGELHIPRQRWDMTLFVRTVDPGEESAS
jgi:TubC N-terminal docking domain